MRQAAQLWEDAMRRLFVAVAVVALAAGCGSDSTGPQFPNAKRVTATVTQAGFSPDTVHLNVGDTLVFTAGDDHHSVSFFGSNLPPGCCTSSGNLNTGETSTPLVFQKAGNLQFRDDSIPADTGLAMIQ
jgi:plastocyanin